MPVIKNSSYTEKPFWLFNPHLETIWPSALRKVEGPVYERSRINTPDGDFLDLDWVKGGNNRLMVISHGLEGDSGRPYVRGMAKAFAENGWDVLAWNCRSCSGELNRGRRMYHHGVSDDLKVVVDDALASGSYNKIFLTGFSMGGSITLKYLGETAKNCLKRFTGRLFFLFHATWAPVPGNYPKKAMHFTGSGF